ncbi:hypothetical protein NHX12_015266, partial [Muraenolepis orangiensis]
GELAEKALDELKKPNDGPPAAAWELDELDHGSPLPSGKEAELQSAIYNKQRALVSLMERMYAVGLLVLCDAGLREIQELMIQLAGLKSKVAKESETCRSPEGKAAAHTTVLVETKEEAAADSPALAILVAPTVASEQKKQKARSHKSSTTGNTSTRQTSQNGEKSGATEATSRIAGDPEPTVSLPAARKTKKPSPVVTETAAAAPEQSDGLRRSERIAK